MVRQPDEYEDVIRRQMAEIDRLRNEVKCLTAEADAHGVLKAVYLDRDAPQSLRVKAASAALPVEKPKLLSVMTSRAPSRFERWRVYARYQRKTEIILETGQLPAPGSGWDAQYQDGVYQPPDGDAEPPLDLYGKDAITAHHAISSLARMARNRNGNGGDEPSDASSE
jgi:hypothetical protein